MSLLRAARGGVIEDLNVDWGVQGPPSEKEEKSFDDDFEMIPDETASTKTAVEPPAPAPINLFDTSTQSTSEDLGPKKMIINLPPPPRIQQAPKSDKLPIPLYPGFRCSIFSIIKVSGQMSFPSCVRINGKVMGSPVTLEIPVTPITLEGRAAAHLTDVKVKLLHSLAARALIQDWEDKEKTEKNRAEIERLGKRYSLASSATSFLAIDGENKKEIEKGEGHYQEPEPQVDELHDILLAKSRITTRSLGSTSRSKAHGAVPTAHAHAAAPRPSRGAIAPMGGSWDQFAGGGEEYGARALSLASPSDTSTLRMSEASFGSIGSSPSQGRRGYSLVDSGNDGQEPERRYRRAKTVLPAGMVGSALPASAPVPAPGSASPSQQAPSNTGGSKGGGGGFLKRLVSRSSAAPPPPPPPASVPFSAPLAMQMGGFGGAVALSASYQSPPPQAQSRQASDPGTLTVESIARAQQFDGSFPVNSDFIRLLTGSSSTPALPGELTGLGGSEQAKQIIWVTVLVLAVLAKKFAKDKDSWEMLAEKSSEFVETSLVSMGVDRGNAVMVTGQLKVVAARNI